MTAPAQVWFITGSSRGLGGAVAEEALAAGRDVVATARRTSTLDDLAQQYGEHLLTLPLDVTDPAQASAAAELAVALRELFLHHLSDEQLQQLVTCGRSSVPQPDPTSPHPKPAD
jgi:NAD(P)-dependent dehydrogenase (short-subunit alcohol dehydrogenase family)